jgi:hypothetical protein
MPSRSPSPRRRTTRWRPRSIPRHRPATATTRFWITRRRAFQLPRWLRRIVSSVILRALVVFIVLAVCLDYVIPIIGNIAMPPRTMNQPVRPYGLTLVDTLPLVYPVMVEQVYLSAISFSHLIA